MATLKGSGLLHPQEIIATPALVQSAALTANTPQTFDAPTGARFAVFASNVDFVASYGSTGAALPTTTSTASSSAQSELNPTARNIGSTFACTGITINAATSGYFSVSWYGN